MLDQGENHNGRYYELNRVYFHLKVTQGQFSLHRPLRYLQSKVALCSLRILHGFHFSILGRQIVKKYETSCDVSLQKRVSLSNCKVCSS